MDLEELFEPRNPPLGESPDHDEFDDGEEM